MAESLKIASHKGEYQVRFQDAAGPLADWLERAQPHFLVDAHVAQLHRARLGALLESPRTITIEATEENKSIERIIEVLRKLVDNSIRRDHLIVAIGGGIVQDITCFAASTLLRGVRWKFVPTTLLAQADSCIGSKSSVNLGNAKNILGTFYPPAEIVIDEGFLNTLSEVDVRSGIGEILKVHAIDSVSAFEQLARDYERLNVDAALLQHYIARALAIKKRYIETDEFDTGVRNVFNYGHSFGHAIESATDFRIPHGIAVTIGMEIANYVAAQRGLIAPAEHVRMRSVLKRNYRGFEDVPLPFERIRAALQKDKKNTSAQLVLILPQGEAVRPERTRIDNDTAFGTQLHAALSQLHA